MATAEQAIDLCALMGTGVTVTLKELLDSRQALYHLSNLTLRFSFALKLRRVLREVEPVYELWAAREKALLETYADIDEARGLWEFKGAEAAAKFASRTKYDKAIAEAVKEEVTFDFALIMVSEVEAAVIGDVGVSAAELFVLGWLIRD